MNKYEKAFYDKLPANLTHQEKLDYMAHLTSKFAMLPPRQQDKFVRQAYTDAASQFIVQYKGKLVSVPQFNTWKALKRLGIEIEAECILLK